MIVAQLKWIFVGFILCFAGWSGAAQAQDEEPTIVRFGTEGAYPPWNLTTSSGELDGFEIDLAKDLCHRMSVKCEFVAQEWAGIFPGLFASKFDVIMSGMWVTEERRKVIEYSEVYASALHGFGVLSNGPLVALSGTGETVDFDVDDAAAKRLIESWKPLLAGKTVGVQASTINATFIEKYLGDTVTVREYKTLEQHNLDLVAGRIDAVFADYPAFAYARQKPEFKDLVVAGAGVHSATIGSGIAMGLRKEDKKLKTMLDDAIRACIADGTLSTLSKKWFGIDISPDKVR